MNFDNCISVDFGNLNGNLPPLLSGFDDAVDDSLIVQDLAGGNRRLGAILDGIQEGTNLFIE